jgi:hypothetical protein
MLECNVYIPLVANPAFQSNSSILTYNLEEITMDKNLKEKVLVKEKWIRGLLILLFIVIKHVVSFLINTIALFQFATDMLVGHLNSKLLEFSKHLNIYLLQITNFLTFNSDTAPFPFTDWPGKQI